MASGTARLHADLSAPGRARALLGEWLTAWWGPPAADPPPREALRDRLALVASELTGNVVRHAAAPVAGPGAAATARLDLELHRLADRLRLVVGGREGAPAPGVLDRMAPRLPRADAQHGRGLFIVDRLVDGWDAHAGPVGVVVWCEFLDPPPVPSSSPAPSGGAGAA